MTGAAVSCPAHKQVVIEQVVAGVKRNILWDLQIKESTIWQTRFLDHRIRDEDDFLHHIEYMRLSPIKHGYATEPNRTGMDGASSTNGPFVEDDKIGGDATPPSSPSF